MWRCRDKIASEVQHLQSLSMKWTWVEPRLAGSFLQQSDGDQLRIFIRQSNILCFTPYTCTRINMGSVGVCRDTSSGTNGKQMFLFFFQFQTQVHEPITERFRYFFYFYLFIFSCFLPKDVFIGLNKAATLDAVCHWRHDNMKIWHLKPVKLLKVSVQSWGSSPKMRFTVWNWVQRNTGFLKTLTWKICQLFGPLLSFFSFLFFSPW